MATVMFLYTVSGEQKTLTLTHAPGKIAPEVDHVGTRELTIAGNYKFSTGRMKYRVAIDCMTTKEEAEALAEIAMQDDGLVEYNVLNARLFAQRDTPGKLIGKLYLTAITPPQTRSETYWRVVGEFVEA